MSWIVDAAIRFRVIALAVAALLAYLGVERFRQMPSDMLPEFNPAIVEIQTEAPGLSANEVEIMVSFGVEELVNGLPWVKSLKSESVTGLSTVRIEFEPGTDLMRARQLVQERLTTSFLLPNVAKPPVMQQPISSTNRILMIALSSKQHDAIKLSTITQWTVKPRLLGVPGVSNVAIWGERRRQIQVQMDPERMRRHSIKQAQVIASTGDALWMSPLSFLKASVPGTGGWVETPSQRLEIRHVLPMSSAADIGNIGIDGTRLKLSDVAEVVEGHPPLIGDAVVPEGAGLLLVVEKFPGADTVAVTKAVELAMNGLRPGLQGIDLDLQAFRPLTFVEWAIANISQVALTGAVLALLGLGVLLLQWRAPVIGLAAMVLSLLAAMLVLYYRGAGMNALVVSGFAAAIGCVIDDVVASTESIFRRLRGLDDASAAPVQAAIRDGALEARGPLTFALLIGLLAVMPVFFIGDIDGALLQPVVVSYILALLASFVAVLTVVPALTALLYDPVRRLQRAGGEPPLYRIVRGSLGRVVSATLDTPVAMIAVMIAVTVVAAAAMTGSGRSLATSASLLPQFKERDLVIQFDAPAGTSHPEMMRLTAKATRDLRAVPGVRTAYAHFGRAVGGDQVVNVNSSRLWVNINSSADYQATLAGVRKSLEAYPEVAKRVRTFLGDRLGVDQTGARQVSVRVYGQRIEDLRSLAGQVKASLERIDGLGGVRIDDQIDEDQLHVTVDLEAAAKVGLKPGDVRRAASTLFSGIEVGRIFEAQKVYEVIVWSTPDTRRTVESLAEAQIELPGGNGHARLGSLAKIAVKPMPTLIKREGVSLYLDVIADIGNRRPAAVAADIEARVRDMKFPLGYYPAVLGERGAIGDAGMRPLVAAAVAAFGILLLLQACFRSWQLALAFFTVLPLAVSGGLAAAVVLGLPTGLGTIFGALAIFALATRIGVGLVSHLLAAEERAGRRLEASELAAECSARLVPALVTLACTALAMLPVLLHAAQPGIELLYPMAVVVLGGLLGTLLLTVLVLPALYRWLGAEREPLLQLESVR